MTNIMQGEYQMRVRFGENGNVKMIQMSKFNVLFTDKYGFFIGNRNIELHNEGNLYKGNCNNVFFLLKYEVNEDHLAINIEITNKSERDIGENIGFHTGIDSYMENYPQWHDAFFPTLLRCEKTHLWGYYLNTAENALAIATTKGVSSHDIKYNMYEGEHCGHRIIGTDILFIQNNKLPRRHPNDLKVLKAGEVYKNTIYYIPTENKNDILPKIAKIADIPMIYATKYTYEKGEKLDFGVYTKNKVKTEITFPDGKTVDNKDFVLEDVGIYRVRIYSDNGKISEAMFCCREDWDFYLYNAGKEAIAKPQRATTHVESYYGLFSAFLAGKHFDDEIMLKKAYECFDEIMPFMFDFSECIPIVSPTRIQNVALIVSLLVDIYEVNPKDNMKYLEIASKFGDWIVSKQDDEGVYRNKGVHYTCVIYIAKAMLELVFCERECIDTAIREKSNIHYESARRAVDELVRNLDNIDTEGELTLEDGMISCSALQIGMFALTLPEEERERYITAAEYMIKIHACLEQQLIPDCRMNGCSLRFWESQYDVMIRANMLNSPHGWTGWTAYMYYYIYMLTGKKEYLVSLMNTLGSCAQLIGFDGKLRWGFCAQPYVKAKALVPDAQNEVLDGYKFVDSNEAAYRGKYEIREFGEEYIDMISGWYRTGEQKVTGGYEFCPLVCKDGYVWVDNQGGCCDNDVHEIFKCIEECVLHKAFVYENEDGSFLTYGCRVKADVEDIEICTGKNVAKIIYNLKKPYKNKGELIDGFGEISWQHFENS